MTTTDATLEPTAVSFYFDPACPWTWATSRWLVDVAARQPLDIAWRAFELSDGRSLDDVPEPWRAGAEVSRGFLRIVEAAHAGDGGELIGPLYTAYGSRLHDKGEAPSFALLREAADEVGLPANLLAAADQEQWALAVAAARAEAEAVAGDDIGSPVLVLDRPGLPLTGFFGPVLHPAPTGAEADRLWRLVLDAADSPLFELKRRRTSSP